MKLWIVLPGAPVGTPAPSAEAVAKLPAGLSPATGADGLVPGPGPKPGPVLGPVAGPGLGPGPTEYHRPGRLGAEVHRASLPS